MHIKCLNWASPWYGKLHSKQYLPLVASYVFNRSLACFFTSPSTLHNSQNRYWKPTVSPLSRFSSLKMQCFLLYSLCQTQPHTWNYDDSKMTVTALTQEKFAHNHLLREFCNFFVKPRWRSVVKHRQNVRKPSFCKLTMEMPIEVTLWQCLVLFCVRCKFFGQFQRLVQTKIWPSSIIIRYRMGLNFRGTKLSRIADSHYIRGFVFADEGSFIFIIHIDYISVLIEC